MLLTRKQTADYQNKIVKQLETAPDIKRRHLWSEFEDNILKKYYFKKDRRLIAKLLNRSVSAIECRVDRLGLRSGKYNI